MESPISWKFCVHLDVSPVPADNVVAVLLPYHAISQQLFHTTVVVVVSVVTLDPVFVVDESIGVD